MFNIDIAFSRELLRHVVADVRRHFPGIKVSEAWVWRFNRDHWEFHGPNGFYWNGTASNAYEARCNGWSAYLRKTGKETD